MKDVRRAFEHALADSGGIDAAIATAEAFLATHGDHPVAGAYLGSLNGMKAGEAALPWVKLRLANLASELLDRAHARRFDAPPASREEEDAYPGTLVILLLRGIAYASFPPFLGRREAARDSLEEAMRHPGFAGIPASYRALACSHLAVMHAHESAEHAARRLLDEARRADGPLAEKVWAAR